MITEIVMIASMIIATVTSVDQSVANALANSRSTKIAKRATELAKQISKDQELSNRLIDAYNRRDTDLTTQLLNSSPFGNRFYQLKKEFSRNQSNLEDVKTKSYNIEQKASNVQNKINEAQSKAQTSGSAIADLISGAALVKDSDINYQPTEWNQEQLKEINYDSKK